MRRLHANGTMWGAYGQLIVVTGPVFTGFALYMGLEAADIALIASIVALAGLVQPLSSALTGRLRNQKAFVIRSGILEVTLTTGVILVPLLIRVPSGRFAFAAAATLTGTFTGNIVAPLFNSWFSTVLPEESRAQFMGKRLVLMNLAAIVVGYSAGRFIDFSEGGFIAFLVPYLIAWIFGVGGYAVLSRIPFPSLFRPEGAITFDHSLVTPLRNRQFRKLLIYFFALVFSLLISEPFYNVFMIRDLGIGYTTIGVYNAIVLGVGIVGYWIFGTAAGKFGCKPILQLLMVPRLLLPLIWIFVSPGNYRLILPFIMASNGIVFSGLTVAINTLLFGSVSEEADRAGFFAIWAFGTSLFTALATAVGGLIVRNTASLSLVVAGVDVGGIKLTFAVSGLLMIFPLLLLHLVTETEAKPVRHILGQVLRGNPVAFVYNSFVFSRNRRSRTRARAIRGMAKSRNPMAVERLASAIGDLDPSVREQAVKGLGRTRSKDAVHPLAATLADEESDLRVEAADSLGRLRHSSGIDPLFAALDSEDNRVAISAARALGDIGGAVVVDRLFEKLVSGRGARKGLLPSLIESSSRLGDTRIILPALASLESYQNQVIRLQLLNAVCRVLGARDLFYNLLTRNEYDLAEKLDQILLRIEKRASKITTTGNTDYRELHTQLRGLLEDGDYAAIADRGAALAENVELIDPRAMDARDALKRFTEVGGIRPGDRPEIFTIVCLGAMVDASI